MLRISFFLSVICHMLLLAGISLFFARQTPQHIEIEKRFSVSLQKHNRISATSWPKTPATSSPRPLKPSLSPSQEILPLSPDRFYKRSPEMDESYANNALQYNTPFPKISQKIEPIDQSTRGLPVKPEKSIILARELPTPPPISQPTPQPIIPDPGPASVPTIVSTPTVATPSQAQLPSVSEAPPPTISQDVPMRKPEEDLSKPSAPESVDGQQEKILLANYLQDVAARIRKAQYYPRTARRKGWEGTVLIALQILPTGEIGKVELIESSRHETLDKAALDTIEKAQPFPEFPAELGVLSITARIPIRFVLGD